MSCRVKQIALGLIVAGCWPLWGQAPESWGVSFSSSKYEEVLGAVGLADGGVVVHGQIFPGTRHFVSRFDRWGRPLWHRSVAEASIEALAGSGEWLYVLVGSSNTSGLAKLNLDGQTVWYREVPRKQWRLAVLPSGAVALFGEKLLLIWPDSEEYTSYEFATLEGERIFLGFVGQTEDGSLWLQGGTYAPGGKNGQDYIWRLSPTGEITGSWAVAGSHGFAAAGVWHDGSLTVVGSPRQPTSSINSPVARVDPQGNVVWVTALSGDPPVLWHENHQEVFFNYGLGFVKAERGLVLVDLDFSLGPTPPDSFHALVFLDAEGNLTNAEGVWRMDFHSWGKVAGLHPDGSVLWLQRGPGTLSDWDAFVEKMGGWAVLNPACPKLPIFVNTAPGYLGLVSAGVRAERSSGQLGPSDIAFETFFTKTEVYCSTSSWDADVAVEGAVEREENIGTNVLRVAVKNLGPKDAYDVFLYGLPEEPTNAGFVCWREEPWQGGLVSCYLPEIKVGGQIEMFVVLPRGYRLSQVFCDVAAWNPDPNASNNRFRLRLARRALLPKPGRPVGR